MKPHVRHATAKGKLGQTQHAGITSGSFAKLGELFWTSKTVHFKA
jgi:hypothetical protein